MSRPLAATSVAISSGAAPERNLVRARVWVGARVGVRVWVRVGVSVRVRVRVRASVRVRVSGLGANPRVLNLALTLERPGCGLRSGWCSAAPPRRSTGLGRARVRIRVRAQARARAPARARARARARVRARARARARVLVAVLAYLGYRPLGVGEHDGARGRASRRRRRLRRGLRQQRLHRGPLGLDLVRRRRQG